MSGTTITLRGLAQLTSKNLKSEGLLIGLPEFEGQLMDEFMKRLLIVLEGSNIVSGQDLQNFRNGKSVFLSAEQLNLLTR